MKTDCWWWLEAGFTTKEDSKIKRVFGVLAGLAATLLGAVVLLAGCYTVARWLITLLGGGE